MPTRRQIATSIFSVYRRQQARVGYVLPANIVAAFSERSGWSVDETETAINYGCAEGWFEFAPHLFPTLTNDGFAEMQRGELGRAASLAP